jgi:hypothetical protein
MAPELWVVRYGKVLTKYSPKIDIWSAGLVFLQIVLEYSFPEEDSYDTICEYLEYTNQDIHLIHKVIINL